MCVYVKLHFVVPKVHSAPNRSGRVRRQLHQLGRSVLGTFEVRFFETWRSEAVQEVRSYVHLHEGFGRDGHLVPDPHNRGLHLYHLGK